jgi:hypothetical protein
MPSRIERWATSCVGIISTSTGAESHDEVLAGADFFTVEVLTWRWLVLHTILHRSKHPPGICGRHHAPSGVVVDAAGGAQRHDGGQRLSERLSLPAARSRPEVLPRVSRYPCGWWCEVPADAERWARSIKEECLLKLILFSRELAAARRVRISGTFPPREKTPRQEQPYALPRPCSA